MKKFVFLFLCMILGNTLELPGNDSYNFFMFSDTHFGTAKRFCTDPKAPKKHRTRKNIHRADKAMPHYKALFSHIARSADPKTKFIIEGGDLIEGCAVNEEAHKQELTDALAFMKKYFPFPIYMVKGNRARRGSRLPGSTAAGDRQIRKSQGTFCGKLYSAAGKRLLYFSGLHFSGVVHFSGIQSEIP